MLADPLAVQAIAGLPSDDPDARVVLLLGLASSLVSEEMGYTEQPDPIPTDVTLVTIGIVVRALANPNGVLQDTAGPFTVRYADTTEPGLYMTGAERQRLHRLRASAPVLRGLWTLPTTRGEPYGAVWVEEYDPFAEGWPA